MRPSSPPKWAVMTDANGCQYLFSYVGGVTPRLTVDGKHMGCWENPDNHPKDKVGPRNQQ
jgi:hypothetical protein